MKTDKEVRSLYKMLEGQLENQKNELDNEFFNVSTTRQRHIGYEIDLLDDALDKLYEAYDLWASELSDNDDTFNIFSDIQYTFFGSIIN